MHKIFLRHQCHICNKAFENARNLRRHLKRHDNINVPTTRPGKKKQLDTGEGFQVVDDEDSANDIRYSCAICSDNFASVTDIGVHFQVQHLRNQDGEDKGLEEQYTETEISTVEQTVEVKEEEENPFLEQGSPSARVAKKRRISSEQSLNENLYSPNRPKLTATDFIRLAGSYEFEVVSHGNSLTALNQMTTMQWLKSVLDQDTPSAMFELTCSVKTSLDTLESKFWRTMQLTLFDYYSMVHISQGSRYAHNHERTFYVERIVPMFKYLAGMTGLMKFRWCETKLEAKDVASLVVSTLQSSTVSYIDGIGEDDNGEVLLIEASSGAIKENVGHTHEDSLKLIDSARFILKKEMMKCLDAKLESFCCRKVIIIQTVMNKMTLSTVSQSMNTHSKCKVTELCSACVPISWKDRYHWLRVFELLAQVKDILVEQQEVVTKLDKEKTGFINVGTEETVRFRML